MAGMAGEAGRDSFLRRSGGELRSLGGAVPSPELSSGSAVGTEATSDEVHLVRGFCPRSPEIYRLAARMADLHRGELRASPLSQSGTESALELRLRSALSSAQIEAVYAPCSSSSKMETMSVCRTANENEPPSS